MGMYTALEVHVKLKYDQRLAGVLSTALFGDHVDDDDLGFTSRIQNMFRVDGGRGFGPSTRWLEVGHEPCPGCDRVEDGRGTHPEHCERGFIVLYSRSSYKGITHWDFIDWIKPDALGGFVRWNQEGIDREEVHSFGPLGQTREEDALLAEAASADAQGRDGTRTSDYWRIHWAEGVRDALTRMRGARAVLPASVVNTFVRCKDDTPTALRHEIERLL